mmetsp:Transcript_72784/g.217278  ORF Transcript_72784/g.217278 Transcript_72784/m.217278 type:complete len:713 (+) Transcript_72784:50-2188(+)
MSRALGHASIEELESNATSDEELKGEGREDECCPRGVLWLMGLLLLGAVVIGVVFLVGPPRDGPVASECLGFDECPEYPEPYLFGQWPTAYEFGGSLPPGFVLGVGTSAYQIEGAYREGGRGASVWDTFTGADTVGMPGAGCGYCCKAAPCPVNPAMSEKGATGNVACDHYHTVRDDIALMKSMGLRHYRFSIAWPRIFPTGFSKDGVNEEGIAFYNRLVDALLAAGVTPLVTLYHWDLPQGLLDPPRWQGWWSRDNATGEPDGQITDEFVAYADVCFRSFGDRVKMWVTFNEPWSFTWLASGYGKAPSIPEYSNMSIDPYIAGHNVLNAHAAAVDLYRRKYQATQGGKIGLSMNADWREPWSDTPADIAAAERAVLFRLGWFADPLYFGDYPAPMRRLFGGRLPRFTEAQKRLLKGSTDFFGLNSYGTGWAADTPDPGGETAHANITELGLPRAQSAWLYAAGWGLRKLLNWISRRYHNPSIYVTEGGWSLAADTADQGAADQQRIMYYANYTSEIRKAVLEDGVDVRAYFAWSFLDNFEWNLGYAERFGTTYNDFAVGLDSNAPTNRDRQPTAGKQLRRRKESSCWLESVWRSHSLIDPGSPSFAGCANSSVFEGKFRSDKIPDHVITVWLGEPAADRAFFGRVGSISVPLPPMGWPSTPVPAQFSGGTVLADFTRVPFFGMGSQVLGYWNLTARSIEWGDGSVWTADRK